MTKESLYSGDNNIILREVFQSEDTLRTNQLIPTSIVFNNGVGVFDGSTSYISFARPLKGTYSIRIKLASFTPGITKYILDCRANGGIGYIRTDSTTTISSSSGTIYVDGVLTSTVSANSKEIVVSGISLVSTLGYIGRINTSVANLSTFSIDIFEIWKKSLSVNEIKALKNNSFFTSYEYVKKVIAENANNWYGVSHDITANAPEFTRLGNLQLHKSLPIQSQMRRCVLKDDGTVNYYLHPTNSLLKANGTIADLTGVDGQWMVEIPYHYFYQNLNGNILTWKFSQFPLAGYTYIPRHYVSAGEATIQRSTNKMACVINATADYRGGNNNAAWDAEGRTLLGKPATVFSRTSGRSYAANRAAGWMMDIPVTYNAWRRLMFCEYATRNMQLAFNATPTAQGYKQGGLGPGVTNASGTEWNGYNSYYPFINIGVTASLGNASGVIDVSVANFGGAGVARTHQVNSYRGIENPWGHIWKWLDGYNIWAQTVAEGSKTLLYVRNLTSGFVDDTATGYTLVGELPRTSNYVRTMFPLHLFPSVVGGTGSGSTTFWCDYFYTDATTSFGWRAPLVGGYASSGSTAGPVYVSSNYGSSSTFTTFGSRLVYLPN